MSTNLHELESRYLQMADTYLEIRDALIMRNPSKENIMALNRFEKAITELYKAESDIRAYNIERARSVYK